MPDATASRRGRRSRRKGAEGEREVVALHRDMGVQAVKVPLSGATGYQSGEDVDIHIDDGEPLRAQVKRQATDSGWKTILGQLGNACALFLHQDRGSWFVLMPLATYKRLLKGTA